MAIFRSGLPKLTCFLAKPGENSFVHECLRRKCRCSLPQHVNFLAEVCHVLALFRSNSRHDPKGRRKNCQPTSSADTYLQFQHFRRQSPAQWLQVTRTPRIRPRFERNPWLAPTPADWSQNQCLASLKHRVNASRKPGHCEARLHRSQGRARALSR